MSSLKFDSARLWGISETEILETWSGGIVANKQSKKPGYKVTSIQQCGNNRGGDMKLNYESWCDACGALWTAVRNCCCGEEVTIITRSWQSSQDHGNHQTTITIITRPWQSSEDHWIAIIWTFSVWRLSMSFASREEEKDMIHTHIQISQEEWRILFTISVFPLKSVFPPIVLDDLTP